MIYNIHFREDKFIRKNTKIKKEREEDKERERKIENMREGGWETNK